MKITDNRLSFIEMPFEQIRVGGTFLDNLGRVCIKVSENNKFNLEINELLHVYDPKLYRCQRVDAELVVTDYRGEDDDNR